MLNRLGFFRDKGLLCLIYKRVIRKTGTQMMQEMLPKMDLQKQ